VDGTSWPPVPIVVTVVLADCWVGARVGQELCVLACPWPQQDATVKQHHVQRTAASAVRHSIVRETIETHSRIRSWSTTPVKVGFCRSAARTAYGDGSNEAWAGHGATDAVLEGSRR
jgi:hypothetical protein